MSKEIKYIGKFIKYKRRKYKIENRCGDVLRIDPCHKTNLESLASITYLIQISESKIKFIEG